MKGIDSEARPGRLSSRVVLLALCFAMFMANSSSSSITPFLLDLARDLETDLAAVGVMLALHSVVWASLSGFAGAASDRFGRRPVMLIGLAFLALSPLGIALSPSYWPALLARMMGGVGGGAFVGVALAAASDVVPPGERGRAFGWMITAQSLSLLLGVPMIAFMGAFVGWRGALAILAATLSVAALLVWIVVPARQAKGRGEADAHVNVLRLLSPRLVTLLLATTAERFCFASVAVYFATYLITSYGVPLDLLAGALAVVATGTVIGSVIGGELSDRVRSRTVLAAISLATTGLIGMPLLLWQPGLAISVAIGCLYSVINGLSRPSLMGSVTAFSDQARGAILGVNMTFVNLGWLSAQSLGGWLIATTGFTYLGFVVAGAGLTGAVLALAAGALRRPAVAS